MAGSKLIKLLNNDPKFFYYNGNNNGGIGNFSQKSLKYGHDRPGNGNSGQPYINTVIPTKPTNNAIDDGYIRGGATLADKASIIDKERIKRFFNDKPKGTLFVQRQTKLQFTNPKLEVKRYGNNGEGLLNGLAASVFNVVNEFVPGPTRLYNAGFNTLAQVGENAFGQHFDRHGLAPVQDDNSKYLAVAQFNNQGNGNNNRLIRLKNKLIKQTEPASKFLNSVNFIVGNVNALFGTKLSTKALQAPDLTIDDYLGGPNSSYGNGRTLIRRFDITGNDPNFQNKQQPTTRGIINYVGTLGLSTQWLSSRDINNSNYIPGPDGFSAVNQTAVKYDNGTHQAGANGTSNSPTTRDYLSLKKAIEEQSNVTQRISNGLDQARFFTTKTHTVNRGDSKFKYNLDNLKDVFNRNDSDLLTVSFFAINPFGEVGDAYEFAFSGYMKGFRDNFDATWNEYNYVGRSESFYTYGKFKRNVSFNLDIPCFNKTQLLEKHRALGQLAATTAGAYNKNGLLSGVILKVKVGGYLDNEYAILNNISYEIPDDSPWDVDNTNINNPGNKLQLAMNIKANISLTIIHSKGNKPAQYTVPDTKDNPNAGFFGYLTNPISGKLPAR